MESDNRIVIAGSGFAGMWAALGAARLIDATTDGPRAEVVVVSPKPELHVRPRLYEAGGGQMTAPLTDLFDATGITHVAGTVQRITARERTIRGLGIDGRPFDLGYGSLVIAAGSELRRPDVPGLDAHGLSIDSIDEARRFDEHLARLAQCPESPGRNTFVVVGGGFTGIEIATELPGRIRALLGPGVRMRVVLIEQLDAVGPDLGPGPRPVIEEALRALEVELRLGTTVARLDATGVVTTAGERIDAMTVVWTTGMRASPLTSALDAERDRLGRLHVSDALEVPGHAGVFACGDVARAATDDVGHHALMSCQHALGMGRIAGHNAAAHLLRLPLRRYRQEKYVTCLDLGGAGAVLTEGWDRQVQLRGEEAKQLKRTINTVWIYPPPADRAAALAAADPDFKVVA